MADYSFKRVLVTGGAGFIGSNYVRLALREHPDWSVVVLDKLTYAGNLDNLADVLDRVTFVEGDITNPNDVSTAMAGVHAVVNFAAESHVDRSLMDARPFVKTNVEGTMVLLDLARRLEVHRFLHVSTDEVYGDLVDSTHHSDEADRLEPRSPYSATKAAAEQLVFAYGISFGLDVVVTRGSNTYGPYQYPEKIIPLFITNALEGKALPLYGSGTAVRDYMHVDDHCSGIDMALHAGTSGTAYNLGARLEVSSLTVAETILKALHKPVDLIQFVQDRPGHDYRYAVDPSKAEALGWMRRWSFADGLRATVDWYIRNPDWWKQVRERRAFVEHVSTWYHSKTQPGR